MLNVQRIFLGISLLGLLLLGGCAKSAKGVNVKGNVILPATLKLADSDTFQINFQAESDTHQGGPATFNASDKSFVVNGPENKGIPPGKYKITVRITPYMGNKTDAQKTAALEAVNKRHEPATTKLTYDVTADPEQSITLDLAKDTVTKR